MLRIVVSIVLFLFTNGLIAQKFIALDSRVSAKRWKFFEGDFISYKLKDNQKTGGYITQLNDSSFFIGKKEVLLNEIKSIHFRGHRYGLGIITTFTTVAGVGYFGIDTFNRLINSNDPIVFEGTIIASGVMLSVALISDLLNRKTVKVKDSKQIKVLDLSI